MRFDIMNRTANRIISIIQAERDELLDKINDKTTTKKEKMELKIGFNVLGDICNKIDRIYRFESSDNIQEILRQNYEKHDVILRFVDGTEFIIPGKWDHLVSVDEYTICIHEKSKDKTIIPPILKLFNIDNLVEIKRAD